MKISHAEIEGGKKQVIQKVREMNNCLETKDKLRAVCALCVFTFIHEPGNISRGRVEGGKKNTLK